MCCPQPVVDNDYGKPNSTNLHTHGVHVSASGQSDDVLVEIKPGESHTYIYEFEDAHVRGTWLSCAQGPGIKVSAAAAALTPVMGCGVRADGRQPLVPRPLPRLDDHPGAYHGRRWPVRSVVRMAWSWIEKRSRHTVSLCPMRRGLAT